MLAAPVEGRQRHQTGAAVLTTDDSPVTWKTAAATVRNNEIAAVLPEGTVMAYLAAFDEQDADGKWYCAGTSNVVVVKSKF